MPPHLHPRSRSTSLLFTGTLLAGFITVGMPHIFPCPAPRKRLADTPPALGPDGQPLQTQRKSRSPAAPSSPTTTNPRSSPSSNTSSPLPKDLQSQRDLLLQASSEAEDLERSARECPVPKPTGVLGRWLGFPSSSPTIEEQGRPGTSSSGSSGSGSGSLRSVAMERR